MGDPHVSDEGADDVGVPERRRVQRARSARAPGCCRPRVGRSVRHRYGGLSRCVAIRSKSDERPLSARLDGEAFNGPIWRAGAGSSPASRRPQRMKSATFQQVEENAAGLWRFLR